MEPDGTLSRSFGVSTIWPLPITFATATEALQITEELEARAQDLLAALREPRRTMK